MAKHEPPVADPRHCGKGVADHAPTGPGRDGEGVPAHQGDEYEDAGNEAPGPAGPEGAEADPSGRVPLDQQETADQEAGKDEEGGDAEETALGPAEAAVGQEHRDDREGSHTVQCRQIGQPWMVPLPHPHINTRRDRPAFYSRPFGGFTIFLANRDGPLAVSSVNGHAQPVVPIRTIR